MLLPQVAFLPDSSESSQIIYPIKLFLIQIVESWSAVHVSRIVPWYTSPCYCQIWYASRSESFSSGHCKNRSLLIHESRIFLLSGICYDRTSWYNGLIFLFLGAAIWWKSEYGVEKQVSLEQAKSSSEIESLMSNLIQGKNWCCSFPIPDCLPKYISTSCKYPVRPILPAQHQLQYHNAQVI
jgi:hypothetical protein